MSGLGDGASSRTSVAQMARVAMTSTVCRAIAVRRSRVAGLSKLIVRFRQGLCFRLTGRNPSSQAVLPRRQPARWRAAQKESGAPAFRGCAGLLHAILLTLVSSELRSWSRPHLHKPDRARPVLSPR